MKNGSFNSTSSLINKENSVVSGSVERILFVNQQNGYLVCQIQLYGQKEVVVACGILPMIQEGVDTTLEGEWKKHAKFGLQLHVTKYTVLPPTHIKSIEKYLGSGLIKGIGPAYAKKLIDFFGSTVLTIIDKNPEKLVSIHGIGPKRLEQINQAWIEQKDVADIILFLQKYDIPTVHAVKIYKKYKQQAIDIIIQNPYRLAEDIWGIGFLSADTIANKIGIPFDSEKRFSAGVLHVLSTFLQKGNVYMPLEIAKDELASLLDIDRVTYQASIKNVLHQLYNEGKITLFSHNSLHFITLALYENAEVAIATRCQAILKKKPLHDININQVYEKFRLESNLHEDQQRAILAVLQEKIVVITGGPGTGKTTLLRELILLLKQHKKDFLLAAPTGRAAKRMSSSTGSYAQTLHRLLEFDPHLMQFTKNKNNPLKADFLIIDEASMVDVFLASAVLKAVADNTHVVLVGDSDQLPSVGSGNVLGDIIASNCIRTIQLTHIFRQAQNSLIITNAHRINQGEFFVTTQASKTSDFLFIKEDDPEKIPAHIVHLLSKHIYLLGLDPSDVTVLVPMNRGPVGTFALNQALQKIVNAQGMRGPCLVFGSITFYLHDRVMQIKNNYDKAIFNGDVGVVVACDTQEKTITVLFEKEVTYQARELEELTLAYALSIHKSQGSEYTAVIIPFCMHHYTLLERRLLYTAVTRAKKYCILVGQTKAFWSAIHNNKSINRITFLSHRLRQMNTDELEKN